VFFPSNCPAPEYEVPARIAADNSSSVMLREASAEGSTLMRIALLTPKIWTWEMPGKMLIRCWTCEVAYL